MPDSIGDSINTTGRVTVGNPLTGEIETTDDSDAYAVELVAGRTYRIDLEGAATGKGTLADPFLRWLRDSSGNGLHGTRDYDGGEGLNPRQVFTPQLSGTYYITASGQGASVGTYTLTVTDTSAPVFGASAYGFQLAENTDGSTTRVSLGTVSATDPEGVSVGYSIVGGNESGSFEIDAASGELFYVGAGEDYEAGAAQFDLTIRASDGTLTADAAVSVAITDVPEQTIVVPVDPEILQTVSELAGRVTVGNSLTGEIETTNDSDAYAVELVAGRTYRIDLEGAATGKGTLADPFLRWLRDSSGNGLHGTRDYDGGEGLNPRQVFTPQLSGTYYITASGQGASVGTYTLTVTDTSQQQVVQQAPVFGASAYGFQLAENADGALFGIAVGSVSAVDPEGAPVTYSIEAGDPDGLFMIDAATGLVVYLGTGEDYESGTTSYELTVRASDGDLHSDVTVTVNVTDVEEYVILEQTANEAPVFAYASYAFSLAENADGALFGIAVGSVSAVDPEGAPVTYSIEAGDPDGLFMIDAATGLVVYLGTGEDYESGTTSYELTVRASDGSLHSDATVTVNVTDVEEYAVLEQTANEAPAFAYASYAFGLAENADGSTTRVSLGTVSATDPEGVSVDYSIVGGNESGSFEIDAASGELFYVGAGEDYEAGAGQFDLTIRASDGGLHSDTTVTVNVTDVEEQEIIEPLVAGTVSEPADEDFPTNVSTAGRIVVGETATGNIGTRGDRDWFAVELVADREYQIDLRGSPTGDGTLSDPYLHVIKGPGGSRIARVSNDDGGEGHNSRLTFTAAETGTYYIVAGAYYTRQGTYELEVRDVLPQTAQQETVNGPPAFAETSYAFDLAENTDGSTASVALGPVSATDPENSTLTYSIEGGDPGGLFAIDAATGALSYRGAGEDYESGTTSYELTVRASDGTGHSDVTVTVNVTDVAEAPVFADTSYAFDLPENAGGDTIPLSLGLVQATDAENSTITYSIEGGDPGGLFAIDAATGALSYRGAGEDYESGTTSYELTVRASDPVLHSDVTVTINVADEEEYVALEQGITTDVSEPDDSDFPETTSTTGAVTVGGTATGKIASSGDRDWFAVTLAAGNFYRIDVEGSDTGAGTLADPYLRGVHDANGVRISGTTDDDGGSGMNSRVTFPAVEAGTYYVSVGAHGNRTGTYTLSVTDVGVITDDFSAGTDTTGEVDVGGSVPGEIDYGSDRDWFAVTLEANKTYRIDLMSPYASSVEILDPYFYGIHDSTGTLVAGTRDDDGGKHHNARVYFTPDAAGTYYLEAGGRYSVPGRYTLSVADVTDGEPDDFSAGTDTTGAVEVGGSVSGHLELWHDRDWFSVELVAGRFYSIGLDGSWTGDNTLFDPVLRAIYDTDGNRVASAGGYWGGRRIATFAPLDDGIYYMEAGGGGGDEGTYTLSVTDITHRISDDFEAGTGTTGRVAVGDSAQGEIDYVGDRDWFAVELMAGNTYRFDQEHPPNVLYAPLLRGIHDADGNFIAGTNDSSDTYSDSRVFFTPEDTGTYYVAAGASVGATGSYTLSVINYSSVSDDYAAGAGTTGAVAVGGSATGRINYADDRDWFAVQLEAGKSYQIDMRGSTTGHGTLYGPELIGIHDAAGDLIFGTWARDGGVGVFPNSRVTFTATNDGTYYVEATGNDNLTGTYTLSVTHLTDDYGAGTDTTGTVDVGGSVMGKIEIPNDRDWFAVDLDSGKTYRIDMKGSETGHGTLYNPNLYGVRDAAGDLIPGTSTNEPDWAHNSRVTFTAQDDGIYYVEAGAAHVWLGGGWQGTYTLSVEEVMDSI